LIKELALLSSNVKLNVEPDPNIDSAYKPLFSSFLYVKFLLNVLQINNPNPVPD